MKRWILIIAAICLLAQPAVAETRVKIISIIGDVYVRRGLDEDWQNARFGLLLEDIDTILTGEAAEVILQLDGGDRFTLGPNAILDISDLRKITERDLFLFLMSQKVNRIERRDTRSKLQNERISVVRAERKEMPSGKAPEEADSRSWKREINGANALFDHRLYTNAIVKYHKILDKYPSNAEAGRTYFYLGKSFEAIDEPGRAVDAFQTALKRIEEARTTDRALRSMEAEANEAVRRLKK